MKIIKNNTKLIKQKARSAFKQVANEFNVKLKETIQEPHYWSGFEDSITYRQNGEIIRGANRNIVDTGDLINSQQLDIDGDTAVYKWTSQHAVQVHEGGVNENGYYIPGRPFTTVAVQDFDFGEVFRSDFKKQQ